ncbi:metallophosphoesterase family protein [Dyadobacter sp. CY312]|uniref:purple acid phosphatase family protein n=1 Tax=Dyadobacter sp. CY312 TaxID=2907303 RepID=UPI001F38EDF2|nr:metallophosphoesterase family protein [Dyadobacter sp. CY312]MCE7041894.1 metallophosphoesterase family protein [Dyadobacter sp. CY312]
MKNTLLCFIFLLTFLSCKKSNSPGNGTVKDVVDGAVTRLYEKLTASELDTISDSYIRQFLTADEKDILAKNFWKFKVNVPVTVSLMRDTAQKIVPFWIEESGFKKTGLFVKNESYTYEVWQKDFDQGEVGLGINGFDKHRPVYFISVTPQDKKDSLKVTDVYPGEYNLSVLKKGAFTYHDWDGLILTEVPTQLEGQVLFTTVRGRAREAHLTGAFRRTETPSSDKPDQLLLTWSADPKTTVNVQWRTNPTVKDGVVKYWKIGKTDTLSTTATAFEMEDRLLQNDRYVKRFTAKLSGLAPGSEYQYKVGSKNGNWSDVAGFRTENATNDGFSFIWFGDTHYSKIWGDMAQKAYQRHPDAAFYSIAGDLVSTGLHRDEWDALWNIQGNVFANRPLMPVPGNHDSQDGLGAWMYKEMFSLPENGPEKLPKEMTYSFVYQDALFLNIDGTLPVKEQTAWIEAQLKSSKAKWKFAMFHFPPYNFVEPYDEIMQEWCTLFDKYHVDMVMSGHMHYYLRTKPMYVGKPVADPSKGTIYTISISIPGKQDEWPAEDYAVVRYPDGPLYQHISIKGNKLVYKSLDPEGNVKDELVIEKK